MLAFIEARRIQLAGSACWRRQRPIDISAASVRPLPQESPYRLGDPIAADGAAVANNSSNAHIASARRFRGPHAASANPPTATVPALRERLLNYRRLSPFRGGSPDDERPSIDELRANVGQTWGA
jgi:hypothetical protein